MAHVIGLAALPSCAISKGVVAGRAFPRSSILGNRLGLAVSVELVKKRSLVASASLKDVNTIPAATMASLMLALAGSPAIAAGMPSPPQFAESVPEVMQLQTKPAASVLTGAALTAPRVAAKDSGLPDDAQWRYSEFLNTVKGGKVKRVRFVKNGTTLQLTAVDG